MSAATGAVVAPLRVLVLGGTSDGFELATLLQAERARIDVISSLAGRTATPLVPPGTVRIGGFGGVDGLATYLQSERIDAVIDATHPFAATISRNAVIACERVGVPLVAWERARWEPTAGDRWIRVPDFAHAARRAREIGTRIFLTIGRQELAAFAAIADRWFLVRAIEPPQVALPPQHTLVLARGPFSYADECAIVREHAVDCIVTKDSGGSGTSAKLAAARERGIPVVIVDRPEPSGARTVHALPPLLAWLGERRSLGWPQ